MSGENSGTKERSGSDGFCRMDTGAGDKNLYRKWSSSTEHNRRRAAGSVCDNWIPAQSGSGKN